MKTATSRLKKKGSWHHFSLSLVFVGPARMRTLNKNYLGHDYVTDILTFDLGEGVGEIIICPHMAGVHARWYQTSTEKELMLYVVHGLLHLAGYDDRTPEARGLMQRMEAKLLWSSV